MSFMLLGILNAQAAGVASSFDLLETQVLNSAVTSVSFTGLDAYTDYKHLQIRANVRINEGATNLQDYYMRFNGSATGYAHHRLIGVGSGVYSYNQSATTNIEFRQGGTNSSTTTGSFAANITDILDFSSSTKNTTTRSLVGGFGNTNRQIALSSGSWFNTSPVTSILFANYYGGFTAGCSFSIYGVK